MPTRLGQGRVKSTDPAYPSLDEQLQAVTSPAGSGSGYTVPAGGIPRTHMTQDVQDAIALAESAYQKDPSGIPVAELDAATRTAIEHGAKGYIKPEPGIPLLDLEKVLQDQINSIQEFYKYPVAGIPKVDFENAVQESLSKADSAYQKATTGIPENHLTQELIDAIHANDGSYKKPTTGIPLSDLAEKVVVPADLKKYNDFIENPKSSITDHTQLDNIGVKTHEVIDASLDQHEHNLKDINHELHEARDEFASIGARIDATLGQNSLLTIDTYDEWLPGTFQGLKLTSEGNVGFDYMTEPMHAGIYNIDALGNFEDHISDIHLGTEFKYNAGTEWLAGKPNNLGIRFVGFIYAPYTGKYEFRFMGSGQMRVQIAGRSLLNNEYQTGYSVRTTSIDLEGGRLYPIVYELSYFATGIREFSVTWMLPNSTFHNYIPFSYMNHKGYTATEALYESHIIDLLDNNIAQWFLECDMSEYRAEDDVDAYIATSSDGITFDPWFQTEAIGEINTVAKRFIRIKLVPKKMFAQYTPMLRKINIRYIAAGINSEYMNEIIQARATYLKLKNRFDHIDQAMIDITNFYQSLDKTMIHPEYFMSVRLATIELQLLRDHIDKAFGKNFVLMQDGFADHFETMDFIDKERSGSIAQDGHTLYQTTNTKLLNSDDDWSQFIRNQTDYFNNALMLETFDGIEQVTDKIDNQTIWSTSGNAYTGYSYSEYVAQPFYTGARTRRLTSLKLRRNYSYYTTYERASIVGTLPNGQPDISNPIIEFDMGASGGDQVYTYNFHAAVKPETKYWVILYFYNWASTSSAYSRWWITPNNTSTSDRLRGDNPEKTNLYFWYKTRGGPWVNNNSYFLYFYVEERTGFKDQGTAETVLDFNHPQHFMSDKRVGDNLEYMTITYQSSSDQIVWTPATTDLSTVPSDRFLKVNIEMHVALNGNTPWLNELYIYIRGKGERIISKPIELAQLPTHVIFLAEDQSSNDITYHASRDDGHTWAEILPGRYTELNQIQPGCQLRLMAVLDGSHPETTIDYWGVIGITLHDITGQNITALYEEYEGFTSGQTIVKLKDRYKLGDHSLHVYLNGIRQSLFKDYLEIDEYTIEMTEALEVDDRITFIVQAGAHGAYDSSLDGRLDMIESTMQESVKPYSVSYEYDALNRVSKEIYTGNDLKEVSYEYDSNDRKTKTTTQLKDKIITETYVYNDANQLVSKEVQHTEVIG